ncbi:MAG: hypothetical protein EBZ48_16360 [Proteobacteria bacterium]|nr:hypothetical protein [Pseudomonadota bacterium]
MPGARASVVSPKNKALFKHVMKISSSAVIFPMKLYPFCRSDSGSEYPQESASAQRCDASAVLFAPYLNGLKRQRLWNCRGLSRAAIVIMLAAFFGTPAHAWAAERAAAEQAAIVAGSEQYVQVANAKLRESPKHWGKGILDLSYGTPVKVVSIEGGWVKAGSANGTVGYVHQSALTARKIAFAASAAGVQIRPDDSDVVLAGKGFSAEIESAYRDANKELNFEAVDQMEKLVPTDKELSLFVAEGKLRE